MLATCASLTACQWVRTGDPAPLQPVAAARVKSVGACASTNSCRDSLDIVAMGVSGFLFVPWRDSTQLVMTPPSYTNPTLWWTVFGNWLFGSSPNEARIERRVCDLPGIGPDRLARVRAVLVGHGHYDHLMDLPALARYVPNATVYGSRSVVNTLNVVPAFGGTSTSASRLVLMDSLAGESSEQPGRSVPISESVHMRAIDVLDRDGTVGSRVIVHDAGIAPEHVVRGIHGRQLVEVVQRYQGDRWTALRAGATLRVRY